MYLIIRQSDQIITASSDRPINEDSIQGHDVLEISSDDYQDDMVGAHWTGTYHIPAPDFFHVWNGSDWVDARPPEVKWGHIRGKRNEALTDTDWTQVADNQLDAGQKSAYSTWRQSLRDLPSDYPNPDTAETELETLLAAEPTV